MLNSVCLQELWYELYSQNQEAWLTVRSASMAPVMQIGDRILVKRANLHNIRFGEIIVFQQEDKLVTHRVIGKRVNGRKVTLIQKGDNGSYFAPIPAEKVLGKVVCIRKGEKHIKLDNSLGKSINLLLGIASCFFYGLHRFRYLSSKILLYLMCF